MSAPEALALPPNMRRLRSFAQGRGLLITGTGRGSRVRTCFPSLKWTIHWELIFCRSGIRPLPDYRFMISVNWEKVPHSLISPPELGGQVRGLPSSKRNFAYALPSSPNTLLLRISSAFIPSRVTRTVGMVVPVRRPNKPSGTSYGFAILAVRKAFLGDGHPHFAPTPSSIGRSTPDN
jgi:hypothetical protein